MNEKSGDFEKVMDMLKVQYGSAEIEIFNKELPAGEIVFSREQVEEQLARAGATKFDGDLKLNKVVLSRDFKPLVYEYKLVAKGEQLIKLSSEEKEINYQYIVTGVHSNKIGSMETVIFEFVTATDGTDWVYSADIIAEYNKKLKDWKILTQVNNDEEQFEELKEEVAKSLLKLKELVVEAKAGLGEEFEQVLLSAIQELLPKEIVDEMELGWSSVLDFEESDLAGREKVVLPVYFWGIFEMTKEIVDETPYFTVWIKT